ncbi:GTPase [Streptomyces sp. CA-250714]|uniref:GTPase n=1 Tax=Streptomyces sp. CA-250714 TaxID=3240060 RepID=UPI003D8D99A2
MTSTDATHTGPGEPPERWTGSLPDGWVSAHSEPVEGQLELSLDDGEDAPAPSPPPSPSPAQQHPAPDAPEGPDGSDGPMAPRATAELPRQQSEAAADLPSDTGGEPGWDDGVIARRAPAERAAQLAQQAETAPPQTEPVVRAESAVRMETVVRAEPVPQPEPVRPAESAPQPEPAPQHESSYKPEYEPRHEPAPQHGTPYETPHEPTERHEAPYEPVEPAAAPEPEVRAPNPRGHVPKADTSERGGDHPRPGFTPAPPWRGTAWPESSYGTVPEAVRDAVRETPPPGTDRTPPATAAQQTHSLAAQHSDVPPDTHPDVHANVHVDTETDIHADTDVCPDAQEDVERAAVPDTRTQPRRSVGTDICRDLRRELRRDPRRDAGEHVLRQRLSALRELVGLSRTRLDSEVLAEAGKVLDEATTRRGLPRSYTTVALAGATGSGKSSLFNALTGGRLSEVGMRRPTTAQPVACTWEAGRYSDGGPDGLLDRLGIPQHARHRTHDGTLSGLILVDLPDHDSVAPGHREQVDRMLQLVDAVVWVVDPEKYADALLHEGYLRRLAGHAEVTFVVLNQTDRLTRDAVDAVLDDLRRLLDEDGMALGEHGEPGAVVLSASALTHEGIDVLREELGEFVAQQRAAVLRLTADLDGATERLRPVYADPGPGTEESPIGLTESAREDFEDRLAVAVGAAAAGQAAERAWLRQAERSSGIPWVRALRWYASRPTQARDEAARTAAAEQSGEQPGERDGAAGGPSARRTTLQQPLAARPVVAQAVRELADAAAGGLPSAWARTVRESARRGAAGLPEVLDEVMEVCASGPDAARRASITASMTDVALGMDAASSLKDAAAPTVPAQQSLAEAPAPGSGTGSGKDSGPEERSGALAKSGSDGAPETAAGSGTASGAASVTGPVTEPAIVPEEAPQGAGRRTGHGARVPRPTWHTAAFAGQWLLFALQVVGAVWAVAVLVLARGFDQAVLLPCALFAAATVAGPVLAWACRRAARGPARTYGLQEERRLRQLAACCGRTRVLEPVAAELLRYRQVREQYAIAAGVVDSALDERPADAGESAAGTGEEAPAGVTELCTTAE